MAETYNIKWRSHAPETISALNRLRCQGALSDAVVMCRSQVFRAHKLILSLCSEYFEEVFINYPAVSFSRESVFVMHQTSPQLFRLLLDFMYTGEVEVKRIQKPARNLREIKCFHHRLQMCHENVVK